MIAASQSLPCESAAAQQARHWIHAVLGPQLPTDERGAELMEDISLCVSELVTNAYQAGCERMRLHCTIDGELMRLAVVDDAPGRPRPGPLADPRQSHGRGLYIVDQLARRWGVSSEGHGRGKEVWLEFRAPESR